MARNFKDWLATFKDSIADWNYYTDFNKVYKNVDEIKVELNILNSLINSKDIENDFIKLIAKYPEIIKVIPILIAKRENEIKISQLEETKNYRFDHLNHSVEEYAEFMKNTGLFDLLATHIISDLTDYVKGVEVGLDSNARKNRTGTTMENLVEKHINKLGFKKGVSYFNQLAASQIHKMFGVDVTNIDTKNKADKVFDFVVKTPNCVYAIEVNFYSGGGSKLNETARSFKMIAYESKGVANFKFIWITDGMGWLTAKNNLEETFTAHDAVFNINDLETGKLKEILK